VGIEVPKLDVNGNTVTDFDILLRNAVVEVKGRHGKGTAAQVRNRIGPAAHPLPVIVYGPNMSRHALKSILDDGNLATDDLEVLIDLIRP
jgi:hypothetical protein